MGRYIITGGAGYLGTALSRMLTSDGHEVVNLARNPERITHLPAGARALRWDGSSAEGWSELVEGAHAVINMAGGTIARPHWSPGYRRMLMQSRVDAGRAVVEAVRASRSKTPLVVQMSGVGYYGDTADRIVDESARAGSDYFARVCVEWERATEPVEALGVRRVILRTAPVYGKAGGIYRLVSLPFRLFIGGPLGSGKQYAPWIHLTDWLNAVRFLMDNPEARGVFNLTAPEALTQAESARVFGKALGRPSFMPAPAFALRLALGETADLVLLTGQRAEPKRLLDAGFRFRFAALADAIADIESK